jgi:hypothetical protein
MARVVALVADLMLASRVSTSLSAAGHEVVQSPQLSADALNGADLVVGDLDAVAPEDLAGRGFPVIAFYQHRDTETRTRAEAAGIELVIPRSRMVRELPELVERLLAA